MCRLGGDNNDYSDSQVQVIFGRAFDRLLQFECAPNSLVLGYVETLAGYNSIADGQLEEALAHLQADVSADHIFRWQLRLLQDWHRYCKLATSSSAASSRLWGVAPT